MSKFKVGNVVILTVKASIELFDCTSIYGIITSIDERMNYTINVKVSFDSYVYAFREDELLNLGRGTKLNKLVKLFYL